MIFNRGQMSGKIGDNKISFNQLINITPLLTGPARNRTRQSSDSESIFIPDSDIFLQLHLRELYIIYLCSRLNGTHSVSAS